MTDDAPVVPPVGELPPKQRWKVTVLGNSLAILMVPGRRDRREGPYPELLERLLVAQGHDVRVECAARLYDLAHEGARRWLLEVAPTSPDVLVLNYGVLEAQPNVLPTTLNRHLTRQDPGGPGLGGAWVRHGVPRVWPLFRTYQRRAAALAGDRTWRVSPERFHAAMADVVTTAARNGVLVLVVDVLPPGDRLQHFFPGIDRRIEKINTVLRRVVEEAASPEVRLVEASAIARALGPASVPDGLHMVPEGHRLLAHELAAHVDGWLRVQ